MGSSERSEPQKSQGDTIYCNYFINIICLNICVSVNIIDKHTHTIHHNTSILPLPINLEPRRFSKSFAARRSNSKRTSDSCAWSALRPSFLAASPRCDAARCASFSNRRRSALRNGKKPWKTSDKQWPTNARWCKIFVLFLEQKMMAWCRQTVMTLHFALVRDHGSRSCCAK